MFTSQSYIIHTYLLDLIFWFLVYHDISSKLTSSLTRYIYLYMLSYTTKLTLKEKKSKHVKKYLSFKILISRYEMWE